MAKEEVPLIRKNYRSYGRVRLDPGAESMVQQSARDEADINQVMARYEKTGLFTYVNRIQGHYEDLMDAPSYRDGMDLMLRAQEMFEGLPAKVRKRFGNDPAEFLAGIQDPSREAEMIELGVIIKKEGDNPLPAGEAGGVAAGPASSQEPAEPVEEA